MKVWHFDDDGNWVEVEGRAVMVETNQAVANHARNDASGLRVQRALHLPRRAFTDMIVLLVLGLALLAPVWLLGVYCLGEIVADFLQLGQSRRPR